MGTFARYVRASSARGPNFYVAPLKRERGPQILVRAPILPFHHLQSFFPSQPTFLTRYIR
jgi:hypothetical protein